jgi:adenosylcobinamide-phosphate synthase
MIDQDLESAKKMLPALVGRETKKLDPDLARSAVIESLSENYVDSVLSPLFYFLLFQPFGLGLEAALAFKAMSTMDSMLGYKTEELKELGFAAAKLDDLANYIPARLSVPLIAIASPKRAGKAVAAAFKYHRATPSPNSGWPMSAAAGSLGIKLEKPGYYALFEEGPKPTAADISRALRLIGVTIAITLAISAIILVLVPA